MLRLPLSRQMFFLDGIYPSKPTLKVIITLVHHSNIFFSFSINSVELWKKSACLESFHIIHACLHEFRHVESGRIVIMVAEDWLIPVLFAPWRMGESCSKVVEVSHWLEANAMLGIDLSNLLRNDVVSMLEIDALWKSWNHHKRVSIKVSRPGLITDFISYDILTSLESLSYFFPISNEEIPQAIMIVPQCCKTFRNCITGIVSWPRMFSAILIVGKTILIKLKRFHVEGARKSFGYLMGNGPNWHAICTKLLTQ